MFLQVLLNKRGASPRLAEDGVFGPRTHAAVVAFQRTVPITPANGVAGPSTWAAFGAITERMHRVTAFAQPTGMTCWSAAATIILGNQSVGPGRASLAPNGGLRPQIDNVETFVQGMGWRMVNQQSAPPASILTSGLDRGPLWVAFQGSGFAHAVVFSGYFSDRSGNTNGLVFRVHDPWPPNSPAGTIYGTTYHGGTLFARSVSPPKAAMIAYVAQP